VTKHRPSVQIGLWASFWATNTYCAILSRWWRFNAHYDRRGLCHQSNCSVRPTIVPKNNRR